MKNITTLAAFCALSAAAANAAVTDPVGYVTKSLETGFNLVGITLHEPITASGSVSSVTSSEITDDSAQFSNLEDTVSTWIVEITSGVQRGAIQVVTSFGETTISTSDDLVAAGVVAGDSYSIRAASTINSIFGVNNDVGLQEGDTPAGADIIWVPSGSGTYDQYYRNEGLVIGGTVIVAPSWQSLSGVEAGDTVLPYTDGIFVERKGGPLDLVVSGHVKMTPTLQVLQTGFTLCSSGFAVGSTLDNSGLASSLEASDSPATADVIWIPSGSGSYAQYYYNEGLVIGGTVIVQPSWQTLSGDAAGSVEIPSAMFIQRKGALTDAVIAVPPYSE